MKKLFYTLLIIGTFTALNFFSSCKDSMVYDSYSHTPIAGWEKNDTLSFDIPPLAASGYYQEHLGLRITGAYPFMESQFPPFPCHTADQGGFSSSAGE